MRVDVAEQRQKCGVLLAGCRNLLGSFERLRIQALAEVSVGQVELHIVGIGLARNAVWKCGMASSYKRKRASSTPTPV